MQPADKLVMMANQIAKNLAIQGEEKAVEMTAEHISKFWDPRMRAMIAKRMAEGGKGLEPIAARALERLST
jgi:formate dehydrogenase subunit delta